MQFWAIFNNILVKSIKKLNIKIFCYQNVWQSVKFTYALQYVCQNLYIILIRLYNHRNVSTYKEIKISFSLLYF